MVLVVALKGAHMSVFETLSLMIAFGSLIVAIMKDQNK